MLLLSHLIINTMTFVRIYTINGELMAWNVLQGVSSRAGNSLILFRSELLFFCPKMSEWAIRSKKSDLLIHSFLVSEMSDLLTSLISSEQPEQIAHGRSFPLSDMSNSLTVAHLSWSILANRSQLLIWFELNEWMSKWTNERWVNERIPSPGFNKDSRSPC